MKNRASQSKDKLAFLKRFLSSSIVITTLLMPGLANAQWTQTSCPAGSNVLSFAVSGSNLFAGVNGGYVYVTPDNGATWTLSSVGLPSNASVTSLVSSNSGLLAGTNGNGIYVSSDNGGSWTSASMGLPSGATVNAILTTGSQIFAGTNGNGVYAYSSSSSSWVAANSGLPGNLSVNAISGNGSSIFIATSSGIFRSTNNGTSWTATNTGIPGSSPAINTILVNGSYVYAGTNGNGVYYSSDNGNTWNAYNTSLQSNATILSMTSNGTDIFAGTSSGVFHNPGSGWAAVNTGLASISSTLPLAVSGTTLFAGTNSGVWKSAVPPFAPSSFVPSTNATNEPDSLTFSWNALANATSYQFQISTDSAFSSIAYNVGGLTNNYQAVKGLTNNTTYYWRVNAGNAGGTSAWCSPNVFTTTLLSPTPQLPAYGSTNQTTSLSLSWNAVSTATSYALQVGTDSTFATSVIFSQTNLTAISQTVTGLSNNTVYYWRVNATNAGGTSGWSAISKFSTIVAVPAQPVLALPANNVVGQPVALSLSWNPVLSAGSYALQVSSDSTFSNAVVYSQSNLTGTTQAISGLSNNTTYYWRVDATNIAGTGAWSSINHFSTIVATPTLATPTTGSINQPVSLLLSWNPVPSATSYQLQVASDSNFVNLIYSQGGLSAPSQTVGGLSNSTTYYWRVNATNNGGTSPWSLKFSFATIVPTPTTPSLALPLNLAANEPISLSLSWTAVPYVTSYALQVSTDSTFATGVIFSQTSLTATSQTVNGLANNTRYFWRVDATNAAGASPWSLVNSFTTVIVPPVLVSPLTGATAQPLSETFIWSGVSQATSYTLQIATDSNFVNLFYNQNGLPTTTQTVNNLNNNVLYYWRVNAANSGGTSGWSLSNKFTTVLAGPTLVAPVNGTTNQPVSVSLSWNSVTAGAMYTVQVSTDSTFTSSLAFNQNGITSTSQAVSGLANNTVYFWRVNATSASNTSSWSQHNFFTTTLVSPTLTTPDNASVSQPVNLVLSWSPVVTATSYALQVSTNSSFTTSSFNQSGLTSTSQAVAGLGNSTTYYWRVCATNAGGTSGWSTAYYFTTSASGPGVPVLVSPPNGANNQAVSISFTWNQASGATSYALQVSTDSTFVAPSLYYQSGLAYASVGIGGLANNTTYYWRVCATNGVGIGAWSATNNFSTIQAIPATPTLVFPANSATNQATSMTFSWNPVVAATSYSLQVSTSSSFSIYSYSQAGLTTTNQPVSGLAANTIYYWRACATNAGGTSAWSAVSQFATSASAAGVPSLASPTNNATSQPVALTMSWNTISGAASYGLEVSTDSTFASTFVVNQSGITTTSQAITGLVNNTTYYWRVNAANTAGTGPWSYVNHFTTILTAPTLAAPASAAVGQPLTVLFQWNSVPTAQSYGLMVSSDSTFKTTFFNQSGLATTAMSVQNLNTNTIYYWCVSASNAAGTSNWSAKRSFSTLLSAPVLASPANAATNQTSTVKFMWNVVSSATSYSLQVSADSLFATSLVYAQSGLTTTSQTVVNLINNTQYYWRVSASGLQGTASAWSMTNSFSTAIAPPALVSPANSAASQPVSLTLSWNTIPSATSFCLQVSTDSTFQVTSSIVYNQSGLTATSQAVSGLLNDRVYYWHVNATTSSGGLSQWSSVYAFSTVFAAPITISPVNGATNQPVSLKLSWNTVSSMTSYNLQVSLDSTFATSIVYSLGGIATASQTVTGLGYATMYYWRVNGVNSSGSMTAWSVVGRFGTTNSAPTPIAPVSSISQTATFSWDSVPGSASYSLQVSTDSMFASGIVFNQSNITGTTQTVNNLACGTVYFWRVNATNVANGTGVWSVVSRFTTITAPPALAAPLNNAINLALSDTLSWNSVPQASSYSVQVSPDSTFANALMYTVSKPVQIITGLSNNTLYFWHVDATDAGGTSLWSTKNKFTTIVAAPSVPKLGNSANDSGKSTMSIILTWDSVANATSYTLQIATDSAFTKVAYNQYGIPTTSQTVTGLASDMTYYWRVSASNAGGSSGWSNSNFFNLQASAAKAFHKNNIPTAFGMQKANYDAARAILTVEFAVPALAQSPHVSIKVYSMLGREIAVLIDNTVGTGYHTATYSFKNHGDNPLSAGTYICSMNAPGYRSSHTVYLLKQ